MDNLGKMREDIQQIAPTQTTTPQEAPQMDPLLTAQKSRLHGRLGMMEVAGLILEIMKFRLGRNEVALIQGGMAEGLSCHKILTVVEWFITSMMLTVAIHPKLEMATCPIVRVEI